ncbi:Protein ROD1 [Meyerozyma sp. JA9]|nr:Protein ROD1 [Meyerozyma sp. JA9]
MAKKSGGGAKSAVLFDIRLYNLDHDVLVVKGSQEEAASSLLSGRIVLSINEPLTIRRLGLRLYATLRLNWTETVQAGKTTMPKNHRFDKKIFEHVWDANEFNSQLSEMAELSREHSAENLRGSRLSSKRNKSSSSLSLSSLSSPHGSFSNLTSLNATARGGRSHVLSTGNYEIPFSAVLPGSMPESVEGLPGGSIIYKLEASIDRGKFHQPLVTKKHIRVVRTLTTDAVELSETVAVDNTWPQKVEYSLNVPSKAIAIGSGTPVSMMMVPLLKGLSLGDIKIQLVEYYSYVGIIPPVHNGERVVSDIFIPKPSEEEAEFQLDKWEVESFVRVPASLSKCTQDCEIQNYMKVRHKLKFVIGLVNPDGHVSELRASLPVQLFISPFISVRAKPDELDEDNQGSDDEELFTTERSSTSLNELGAQNSANVSQENSYTSLTGLMAPPLYEKHIYDRLWSEVSPIESPLSSGAATPRGPPPDADIGQFSMSPLDSAQLNENLRLLSLQRQNDEDSSRPPSAAGTPGGRATFNLGAEPSGSQEGDYLTRGRPIPVRSLSQNSQFSPSHQGQSPSPLVSPGISSPPAHLSRVASVASSLDGRSLTRLPTYSQALKSDASEEVLSPAYEPPSSGSHIGHGSLGSNNSSSTALHSLSSSPTHSSHIASPQPSRISTMPSRAPGLSVISPMSVSPGISHPPLSQPSSVAQPSSSASSRSAVAGAPGKSTSSLNLHNLHFLNKKKK